MQIFVFRLFLVPFLMPYITSLHVFYRILKRSLECVGTRFFSILKWIFQNGHFKMSKTVFSKKELETNVIQKKKMRFKFLIIAP